MVKVCYMRTITLAALATVMVGGLLGCQTTSTFKIPGEPVSSGEFYEFVMQFYTKTYTPLMATLDPVKIYATLPLDKARFQLKNDDGKVYDYKSWIAHLKEQPSEHSAKSTILTEIKNVNMMDTTRGTVAYLGITEPANSASSTPDRGMRLNLHYWEKIDDQWRLVLWEKRLIAEDHL